MLYLLAIALVLIGASADHDHEVSNPGNCRETCTPHMCNNGPSPDDRLCAALVGGETRISVDPFHCGEPRCQQVNCGDCGDHQHCVDTCREFKRVNAIKGYPRCNKACNEVSADFKCWQRCGSMPEMWAKPRCDKYTCSEAYCTARGRQDCSAMHNLVDPLGCSDNRCNTVGCSMCGNHEDCLAHCGRLNMGPGPDVVDCNAECQKVEGYKCFLSC